jgi:hypothetical protein
MCQSDLTIQTVVEIGTWKGMGSTECLIRGLMDSYKPEVSFTSLEVNPEMHKIATESWGEKLPSWAKLVHGRIIEIDELVAEELGSEHPDEAKWFEQDKEAMKTCPNVLGSLPEHIDFLFLDGGGFSTDAEFEKLKNRSRIVGMDDTTSRKCKKIRDHIMNTPQQYEIILDDLSYRGGVMIFMDKTISPRIIYRRG